MTRAQLTFGGRKHYLSPAHVGKHHWGAVGRHIYNNWNGLTGIRLAVQLAGNMFIGMSCADFLRSQFFAGRRALRAECETLVSRPDEKESLRSS